jgi:two-component system nitrogen regulation response regulator GlnG/two-component system response regulator HydG
VSIPVDNIERAGRETVDLSRSRPQALRRPHPSKRVPALIVLWSELEADRAGEVLLLRSTRASWGRFDPDDAAGERPLIPMRQRPGRNEDRPPLALPQHVSRRQLDLLVAGGSGVRIVRTGRASVVLNGARELEPGDQADLTPGETILIGDALLLIVSRRGATLDPLLFRSYEPGPDFGETDADGIVGESPVVWKLRDQIAFAAKMSQHVAIFGPTGSGKELTARGVHRQSARGDRPLVAHSAADIPPSLLEVELFGNRPDYPNPRTPGRDGLIGMAHGSSLFLDEIALLPLELQGKLLRVLDEGGAYRRLGFDQPMQSDFRLIAATNRPPEALQDDLLARLKIHLQMPALSDRPEDIPLLVRHLLRRMKRSTTEIELLRRFGETGPDGTLRVRMDPYLLERWVRQDHPFNLRGLESELLRAVASSRGDRIEASSPPSTSTASPARVEPPAGSPSRGSLQNLSREDLLDILQRERWNVSQAARSLRCSRFQLYRQIRRHELKPPA